MLRCLETTEVALSTSSTKAVFSSSDRDIKRSVLNLKEAKFVKDEDRNSRVVIERYLNTFPFAYYLIVHELKKLLFALAGFLTA